MRKLINIYLFLSIPVSTISRTNLHHQSFYITTDFLSLLNSAIDGRVDNLKISGEVCFDHTFGTLLSVSLENGNQRGIKRNGFLIRPDFRYYFSGDECSAFYVGVYFSLEDATVVIVHRNTISTYLKYKESTFEAGVSCGYKVLFRDRWSINPAVFVGVMNSSKKYVVEAVNAWPTYKDTGGEVVVELGVGYRFK